MVGDCGSGFAVLVDVDNLYLVSRSGIYRPLISMVTTEWVSAPGLHFMCVIRGGGRTKGFLLDAQPKSRPVSFTAILEATS